MKNKSLTTVEKNNRRKALSCGTPEMIRTSDARFRKPTLYPLSYGGASCCCETSALLYNNTAALLLQRFFDRMEGMRCMQIELSHSGRKKGQNERIVI